MKQPILGITVVAIMTVVLASGYFLIGREHKETSTEGIIHKKTQLALIETSRPSRRDFRLSTGWIGRVKSRYLVKVVALEEGRISSVDAADETVVKKGDLLFAMSGPRINSHLSYLKDKIIFLRQRLFLVEAKIKRKRQAVKQRFSSPDELEAAEDALARIQTAISKTRHDLQLLGDLIKIRAPIRGMFTRRTVNVGQDAEKGMVLGYITDPWHLRIVATLFSGSAVSLQGKTTITHTEKGQIISAKIIRVFPRHSLAGGTTVWIEGKKVNHNLKLGEAVSGEVILKTDRAALAIPQSAVVYGKNEKAFVFVRHGKNYQKQQIYTGMTSGGWVEVISGITDMDYIVKKGAYELFNRDFNKVYRAAD